MDFLLLSSEIQEVYLNLLKFDGLQVYYLEMYLQELLIALSFFFFNVLDTFSV